MIVNQALPLLGNFDQAVRFDTFMAQALYHPQHGYYSRGEAVFGARGDFITAPELTPLFGHALARGLASVLAALPARRIYEFGAGTGALAHAVLSQLGEDIEAYFIVDLSAGLKTQQSQTLSTLPAHVRAKVQWLSALPDVLDGVVIGNEVLDAMPVRRFRWHEQAIQEAWVVRQGEALTWQWEAAPKDLCDRVMPLAQAHGPWPQGYQSEVCEQAQAWVRTLTARLNGVALMVDYGYHAGLYYHPSRTQGTLRATARHVAHDDFLLNPGQQDLTAHVDFSAMYAALSAAGGQLEGYCTQSGLLRGLGILDMASQWPDWSDPVRGGPARQAVHMLLADHEMGSQFKALVWSRGVELPEDALLLQAAWADDHSGDL